LSELRSQHNVIAVLFVIALLFKIYGIVVESGHPDDFGDEIPGAPHTRDNNTEQIRLRTQETTLSLSVVAFDPREQCGDDRRYEQSTDNRVHEARNEVAAR